MNVPIIDIESRHLAAALVRQLADGSISNEDFEHAWPVSKNDAALRAIKDALWGAYSDFHTHRLVGKHSPSTEERMLFDRCYLFLQSEIPYRWPHSGHLPVSGIGLPFLILSLGLLLPIDLLIRHKNRTANEKMESIGDVEFWPFLDRQEYTEATENLS